MDIIFDLDGTLSLPGERLKWIETKPKNWREFFARVGDDSINTSILDIALKYNKQKEDSVIISTARPLSCMVETKRWLVETAGLSYEMMIMRDINDYRPDYIVKEENLDKMLGFGFNPQIAFDDKLEVIEMYRRRGLIGCHV